MTLSLGRVIKRMLAEEIVKLVENHIVTRNLKLYDELTNSNKIFVKDLCYCKRKAELRKKYRSIEVEVLKKPVVQFGIMIHMALENIFKDYNFEVEVKNEKQVGDYVISGRIDALVVTKDGKHGIEIKSSSHINDAIKMQAKIYNWLFDLNSTIVLLVNEKKIIGVNIYQKYKDETILKMIRNWKSPMWSYECKNCEYLMVCDIIKQKSLLNF